MTAGRCATCSEPTSNTYNLCDACRIERARSTRAAQGLDRVVTDPSKLARTARLLTASRPAQSEQVAS